MATAWRALIEADITLVPIDAAHVEIRSGRAAGARMRLHSSRRLLNPSDIAAIVGRDQTPGLLVVPAATTDALRVAGRAAWSWLVVDERRVYGELRIAGEVIQVDTRTSDERQATPGRPGRVPWGSLTIARRLLERPAATQRALADSAWVSQPRVSQVLAMLADRDLVQRSRAGWTVPDVNRLLTWWLDKYPGAGGVATYWYGLEPPGNQARAVVQALIASGRTKKPATVVSGDVAADIIAPWRNSSRAVIYARTGADLTEVNLTPASMEEATLELIVPSDPGVWPHAWLEPSPDPALPLADPIQILWDVRRSPGSDSADAATRLWEKLRERHADEPRRAA